MIEVCPLCNRKLELVSYSVAVKNLRCIDRHFQFRYKNNKDYFCNLTYLNMDWQWYYLPKELYFQYKGYKAGKILKSIPWFTPDFNDTDKLLNKLKLYMALL